MPVDDSLAKGTTSNIQLLRGFVLGQLYIYILYIYYIHESYLLWEFQDPKIEVLYHIRPYFVGIFPYMSPYTGPIYGLIMSNFGSSKGP